jgi:site-specific DNA recombinase
MDEQIKVCAYCRVSTNSKDQENSFDNQQSYFNREITKDSRYELTNIYADKGISGTSLSKREQFNQMLFDAGIDIKEVHNSDNDMRKDKIKFAYLSSSSREAKFKIIFVKNSSRFARNVLIEDILRELSKKGVFVHFLDINKTSENEGDRLLLQFLFSIDENESRDKSRKVKFGHEEGARRGVVMTTDKIYGYKYHQLSNSLEIIPHEAEVIRKMFTLYSQGIGFRRIINILNDEGIKTRNGKQFGSSSIKRMLYNEKYAGINVRLKYDSGSIFNKNTYPKVKDKSMWVVHEKSLIPAIVDKELFERCCEIRESNINHVWQKGHYKGISEYAGLIYCSTCGGVYTSNVDKGRRFYNCTLKKNKGMRACSNPNISMKKIEDYLSGLATNGYAEAVDEMKENQVRILRGLKMYLDEQIDTDKALKVKGLIEQRDEVDMKIKKLVPLFLKGNIDEQILNDNMRILKKEIQGVNELIIENTKSNDELTEDIARLNEGISQIIQLENDKVYSLENITEVIEKIVILSNGGFDVVLKQQRIILDMMKKYEHLVTEDFVASVFPGVYYGSDYMEL